MHTLPSPLFGNAYAGRPTFVTGHAGFKGSWLALWLDMLGAVVTGFSDDLPTEPAHFALLDLDIADCRGNLREFDLLLDAMRAAQPEIVFHLAAQPLVSASYRDPLTTYANNVLGTTHLLEACRQTDSVRAVVIVTTDKCYENDGRRGAYREEDRLGGHDPYSASKACCEIIAESYRQAFAREAGRPLIATCRAGNAIGGGDWAADRLIPCCVRSAVGGEPVRLRLPEATRPWQHVLEPLSGYLLLGSRLLAGDASLAEPWNIGPGIDGELTVLGMVRQARRHWEAVRYIEPDTQAAASLPYHESRYLMIDGEKIRRRIGWQPVWTFAEGIERTFEWYRRYYENGDVISREQLIAYAEAARQCGAAWCV